MPLPYSQLDPGQIIKQSYDEANRRIRVDVESDVTLSGEQEVSITHVDDSIRIGDGTELVDVTNNSLNVNLRDSDGDAISSVNPLPVVQVSSTIGDSIYDYKTVVNLASSGIDDHTYVVTSSDGFKVDSAYVSASGVIKAEVLSGPSGSLTPKFVAFNSSSYPNAIIPFPESFVVPFGEEVVIRITNREIDPQNVYSTIIGEEL